MRCLGRWICFFDNDEDRSCVARAYCWLLIDDGKQTEVDGALRVSVR